MRRDQLEHRRYASLPASGPWLCGRTSAVAAAPQRPDRPPLSAPGGQPPALESAAGRCIGGQQEQARDQGNGDHGDAHPAGDQAVIRRRLAIAPDLPIQIVTVLPARAPAVARTSPDRGRWPGGCQLAGTQIILDPVRPAAQRVAVQTQPAGAARQAPSLVTAHRGPSVLVQGRRSGRLAMGTLGCPGRGAPPILGTAEHPG